MLFVLVGFLNEEKERENGMRNTIDEYLKGKGNEILLYISILNFSREHRRTNLG